MPHDAAIGGVENHPSIADDPAAVVGGQFHPRQAPRTKAPGADVDQFAPVDARRRAVESRGDAGIRPQKIGRAPA